MAHLPRRTPIAAAIAALAVVGGCGGSDETRVETKQAARCLADDDIETAPRGDPEAATDVLAFEIAAAPTPTRGLLIFVADAGYAETLAEDIAAEARAQGHEAFLLRKANVIAHFLTDGPPRRVHEARIGRCLE